MATLGDLRTTFYGILSESDSSSDYPKVIADKFINKAQLLICTGSVYNPQTLDKIEKGRLPFLDSDYFFQTVLDTTVGGAGFSSGATTIPVASTTGFAMSGALYINGDICTYSGVTATSFTGVSGLSITGTAGMKVGQAFSLPSTYMTPTLMVFDHSFRVKYTDYRDLFQNQTNNPLARYTSTTSSDIRSQYFSPFYTIRNVAGAYYLIPFNMNASGRNAQLIYEKKPTTMVDATDTCAIPDAEMADVVAYIAVAEMLYNRGQEDSGMALYNTLALPMLRGLYTFYNHQHAEDKFNVRVGTAKDVNLNI